jgi:EpsG family
MFDWVSIQSYSYYYFQILLAVVLVVFFNTALLSFDDRRSIRFNKAVGFMLFIFVLLYIGLRPINSVFIDMITYSQTFEQYQEGFDFAGSGDTGFDFFMETCAKVITIEMFFFICAMIYVIPLWFVSKKWFGNYSFYSFLILVASLSFWGYGTNGIRNGMASSLFLFAFAFFERKLILGLLLLFASSFHQTMMLPTFAFIITLLHNDTKKYFIVWLLAIPLSLALGGFWEIFFAGLGFGDERTGYLTDDSNQADFSSTGFRWDFLMYSATGVFSGVYFIIKKGFHDKLYKHFVNIYLLTNAFWILVIRANFSNRFAYISWFMLGVIIIYPLIKFPVLENRNRILGRVILVYFIFSYIFNVILIKQ